MINNEPYKSWNEYEHHSLFHWLIFIAIVLLATVFLWSQIQDLIYNQYEPVAVHLPQPSAVLSLNPKTNTVRVGDVFGADIILDTGNGPIDGVDIYSLHYDPTILEVIDDMPNQSGIQIKPGTIISSTAANSVDRLTGTIKFGQAVAGGTTFNGQGVLATIHFKALAPGNSYLKFDFNKGNTTDTNVAHRGKDQLTRVVDAIYSVTAK